MEITRLIEILNSINIKEALDNLSFEEKYYIYTSKQFECKLIIERIIKEKTSLFNQEETIEVIKKYSRIDHAEGSNPGFIEIPEELIGEKLLDISDDILIQNSLFSFVEDYHKLIKILQTEDIDSLAYYLPEILKKLPDEELVNLINQKKYKEYTYDIISSFKSEEYKIQYLKHLDAHYRNSIILELSDENKKKYIKLLAKGQMGPLIASLNDDSEKELYLNKYKLILSAEDKAKIVSSFGSIETIKRNLKYLKTEKALANFILTPGDKISNLIFNKDEETINFIKLLIDRISGPKELYDIYRYCDSKELEEHILPRLSQHYIKKHIMEYMGNYSYNYKILLYLNDDELFSEAMQHIDLNQPFEEEMYPLCEKMAKIYNLNLQHLITLVKVTDCTIFSQLTNQNIINTINLDEENFQKYMQIFDSENMEVNRSSLSAIINSLLNKKFSIEFPEKIHIFVETLQAVNDGNIELALQKINEVISTIDLTKFNIDAQTLINGILNRNEDIIKIYNKITHEYLTNERNTYVNGLMPETMIQVTDASYESNEFIKYTLKIMPANMLFENLKKSRNEYTEEELAIIGNDQLLINLINFKKNPKAVQDPAVKANLKIFNAILKKHFSRYNSCNYSHIEGLSIEFNPRHFDKQNLTKIMCEVDSQNLQEKIFSDTKVFGELLKHLHRYTSLGWGENFSEIAASADIDMSPDIVVSTINNFHLILQEKQKKEAEEKRFNFVSELLMAECLDSDFNTYSLLLGYDDYQLLRRNPMPNASPHNKQFRFTKALEYLNIMHERKFITVPPVNKNYTLSNGKKINITIGNTNDPINLTFGERTGACMRIGGAGHELFDFCLKNENGFHISFNHPATGKLISRVSCFRNGNTVFLNQVRYPLTPEYTNDMIKEACELISKEIIKSTKDSQFPVLNVVTSSDYVYAYSRVEDLKCKNIRKGFPKRPYTDIAEEAAVVIATATGSLSPVKLGPENAVRYAVGRTPVRKYQGNKASNYVGHIEALDQYFSKTDIENIEIEKKEIIVAYIGEDWYAAITYDNKIISYIQRNSRDPKQAQEEMEEYLKKLKIELDELIIDTETMELEKEQLQQELETSIETKGRSR